LTRPRRLEGGAAGSGQPGHWLTDPKRELWLAWYTTVIFYDIFFIVFFPVTHAQPPPHPYWSDALVANWFGHNHNGLLIGSLLWVLAILLDKSQVMPTWFAYLTLSNALTEVVVAPAWIFHTGVLTWNGMKSLAATRRPSACRFAPPRG
jgi:hypothetical protein